MIIDRISYQRVFPIGAYITERIGLEASLDEKDNPQTELEHLKQMVNELHSATVAGLDETRGTNIVNINPIDTTIQGIIEDINGCDAIDEYNPFSVQIGLVAYKELADQYPEVKAAYDLKMLQLSKK